MLKPFKFDFFINGIFFTDIFRIDPYSLVYKHSLGRKHEKKLLFAELIDCNDNSNRQMRQFAVKSHFDCIVLIGTAVIVRHAAILFNIPFDRFTLLNSSSCMHIIVKRIKSSILFHFLNNCTENWVFEQSISVNLRNSSYPIVFS